MGSEIQGCSCLDCGAAWLVCWEHDLWTTARGWLPVCSSLREAFIAKHGVLVNRAILQAQSELR